MILLLVVWCTMICSDLYLAAIKTNLWTREKTQQSSDPEVLPLQIQKI